MAIRKISFVDFYNKSEGDVVGVDNGAYFNIGRIKNIVTYGEWMGSDWYVDSPPAIEFVIETMLDDEIALVLTAGEVNGFTFYEDVLVE